MPNHVSYHQPSNMMHRTPMIRSAVRLCHSNPGLRRAYPQQQRTTLLSLFHTSARAEVAATTLAAARATLPVRAAIDSATSADVSSPSEGAKNIHLHPRIWLDVDLETSVSLLLSQAANKESVPQAIKDRWAGETIETKNNLLVFYDQSCITFRGELLPLLEALAKEEELKVSLVTIDVGKVPQLAQSFGISSLPTIMGMYKGKPVRQSVYIRTLDALFCILTTISLTTYSSGCTDRHRSSSAEICERPWSTGRVR